MSLSRAFALGCFIGYFSCVSFPTVAQAREQGTLEVPYNQVMSIWTGLDREQKKLVDLVAADFFENDLSYAQQNNIVESQANKYRAASPKERDQIRSNRRLEWQTKSSSEQEAATISSGGRFNVLTDKQKAPFRLHAIERLGLGGQPKSMAHSKRNSAI